MIRKKIDNLFWSFEKNNFEYKNIWPYHTELVFAFVDYIENLSDEQLKELIPEEKPSYVRRIVNIGTDKWLKRYAKTMMIL